MKVKNYLGARVKDDYVQVGTTESNLMIASMPENSTESERWKLGGCPRCHGDLFLDSEDGQMLGHCLQCGYVGLRVAPVETTLCSE
ncbi:MAG: hypothetical protein FWH42_02855 [Dehalococcoidia bacterium]|nr:hypothetical protein [Dehalococcoidia bacterium]